VKTYIVFMKGFKNLVQLEDISFNGAGKYYIQSEMMTIAVEAETPEEAKVIANGFYIGDIVGGDEYDRKKHQYEAGYDIIAIIESLIPREWDV